MKFAPIFSAGASKALATAAEIARTTKVVKRAYAMAQGGRLTSGWSAIQSSADQELALGLTTMRGRSRDMIRNVGYAKRAKVIVVNNVIGAGIGLQAQFKNRQGRVIDEVNSQIEGEWEKWSRAGSCHTGGKLHFSDLERACMGQVFEAGEVFVRKHYRPFGDSRIPFALELIEAERLAGDWTAPGPLVAGNDVRMGVEIDNYGRPVAYWIRLRHPGDIRANAYANDRLERVPASDVFHLHVVDRWPQVRGEPWLHAAARRLNDMDGYAEAEIVAARGAASYMGFIHTPDNSPIPAEETEGEKTINMEPGIVEQLPPGWQVEMNNPNRPNPAMDPFMRMMLREVAASVGVSYESLSRDYSQSNYSSSRLSLLDDRDLWRQLQQWWIRSFREPLHREWMQAAVLSRAIDQITPEAYALDPERWSAVSWKPRGWTWIDPSKDVSSATESIRAGMDTLTHVIAQTGDGRDIEDVIQERKRELEMLNEAGILTDSEVAELAPPAARPPVASEPAVGSPAQQGQQPPTGRVLSIIGASQ